MGSLDPTYCTITCRLWRTTETKPGLAIGYCACDSVRKGSRYALAAGGNVCSFPDVRLLTEASHDVRELRSAH